MPQHLISFPFSGYCFSSVLSVSVKGVSSLSLTHPPLFNSLGNASKPPPYPPRLSRPFHSIILTPPLSADDTDWAYALSALLTTRVRFSGCMGRAASSSSVSFTLIEREGISMTYPHPLSCLSRLRWQPRAIYARLTALMCRPRTVRRL